MGFHGPSGAGKTSLATCFPAPIVAMIRDQGLLPLIDAGMVPRVAHFEPVESFAELEARVNWLADNEHEYRTLVLDGPAPQHPLPGPPRAVGHLLRQPRLADPRRPGQHDEPPVTGHRLGQPPSQQAELPVTPGQDAQARGYISHADIFSRRSAGRPRKVGWRTEY